MIKQLILRSIMETGNIQDLNEWRSLCTAPFYIKVWSQALEEVTIEEDLLGRTYADKLIYKCPIIDDTMTKELTAQYLLDWCKEQGINAGEFVLRAFLIANKDLAKVNTFALIGGSNAGKTYWIKSMMPANDLVGQTVISTDFAFQCCIDKKCIHIPEMTLTKPEQVEEAKKIFEGQDMMVNIKNKEPKILPRTPVFLSANGLPWRAFDNENRAFENRMFLYKNLMPSKVLESAGNPDPRMWQQLFQECKRMKTNTMEWPPESNTEEYDIAIQTLYNELEHMAKQKTNCILELFEEAESRAHRDIYRYLDFNDLTENKDNMDDYVSTYIKTFIQDDARDYFFKISEDGRAQLQLLADPSKDKFLKEALMYQGIQISDILLMIKDWPSVPLYNTTKKNEKCIKKGILNSMFQELIEARNNVLDTNESDLNMTYGSFAVEASLKKHSTPADALVTKQTSPRKRKTTSSPERVTKQAKRRLRLSHWDELPSGMEKINDDTNNSFATGAQEKSSHKNIKTPKGNNLPGGRPPTPKTPECIRKRRCRPPSEDGCTPKRSKQEIDLLEPRRLVIDEDANSSFNSVKTFVDNMTDEIADDEMAKIKEKLKKLNGFVHELQTEGDKRVGLCYDIIDHYYPRHEVSINNLPKKIETAQDARVWLNVIDEIQDEDMKDLVKETLETMTGSDLLQMITLATVDDAAIHITEWQDTENSQYWLDN